MKTDTPRPIYLKDYTPPAYLIDSVDLDVSLHASETRVRSRMRVRANPACEQAGAPLVLDGENIALERVKLGGKVLDKKDYQVGEKSLTLPTPPARPFVLEITTTCNPQENKALSGLYVSRGIFCTQCEAEGFRRITYSLDRPDILSIYTSRIEADAEDVPILLSNGNPVDSGELKGGRHFATWHDPFPKPSYLFALVGGKLDCVREPFTTSSGREVELRIYVEPGKQDRCAWAMDSLKRSMRWDEKRFGREYDLDIFMIVAVSDFNMGAMENKGLNIFNDKLILASAETATDGNYEAIESVVAHEYFHNWTGNRITCRDWFQLCLKEGLTVYRDQEFSADERSRTVQRIADVRALRGRQFPEDAGPLAHPVRPASYIEINNFYTATVYEKGAELCRMIELIVGKKGFRAGMDLYFERHDGDAATVEQFISCFEDACHVDLGQFMLWYEQSGTPQLVCKLEHDPSARLVRLMVEQVLPTTPGQPRKSAQHIPLKLGLIDAAGNDLALKLADGTAVRDGVVHVRKRKQVFTFEDIADRPRPSLLRGFSAPVKLDIEQSDGDLEFLMAHDSDLFNRWQAAQTFATRTIVSLVEAIRQGKRSKKGLKFVAALEATLSDAGLEPAYRAKFITLPSEADIARDIGKDIDPEAIHKGRLQLARLTGRTLHGALEEIYHAFDAKRAKYSPKAVSVGKRQLRLAALRLLAASGEKSEISRISEHYARARNMTDTMAALALLCDIEGPEREAALADFYESWKGDHLVLDNWFGLQAGSSLPSTLETVKGLTQHPLFSIKNPNRARALLSTFASFNPVNFNRPDGEGYEFIADRVLEIDDFNPQIAARMLGAFRSWKSLEPVRRRRARMALKRVAERENVSRDVYEIVSRMLD